MADKKITIAEVETTGITFDENHGLVIDADMVNQRITDAGVTVEDLVKHQEVFENTLYDLTMATARASIDHMESNKEVPNVTGVIEIGKWGTNVEYKRNHQVPVAVGNSDAGKREVYGYMTANTNVGLTKSQKTKMRKQISGYAEAKLK